MHFQASLIPGSSVSMDTGTQTDKKENYSHFSDHNRRQSQKKGMLEATQVVNKQIPQVLGLQAHC